jgi:hypothetical protein
MPQWLRVKQIYSARAYLWHHQLMFSALKLIIHGNQLREIQQSLKHLKSEQTKMLIFPTHTRYSITYIAQLVVPYTQSCGERALARLRPRAVQGGAPADQIHSSVYQIAPPPRPVDLCARQKHSSRMRTPTLSSSRDTLLFKAPSALDEEFSPCIHRSWSDQGSWTS